MAAAVVALSWSVAAFGETSPPNVDFARDIQPILASHCIRCHGPETREAGLRLDDPKSALAELESSAHAIVAGDADASEIIRRVTAEESERMPPEGPPLNTHEIALLRQWIAEGASWPDHWAYCQLTAVAPPDFADEVDERWCRTPIDRFILAELRKLELEPSAEADRRALVRRLYFDVIGMPPTPDEARAFIDDPSPDAYDKLVDRLLASSHYGERWARHWMDVVHYADSHGFEHDLPRSSWPYRDYLIHAFNSDMPYTQFVREQVAGDVLAPDDPRAIAATGFLATGPWDQSALQAGQVDTDDYHISQYLDRDDIVSTIMSTFVSSTVHCARCHDHKFDPISQADYYSLQAVVAGIDKATREYDSDPTVARQRREFIARRGEIQRQLDARDPALLSEDIQSETAAWEQAVLADEDGWKVLDVTDAKSDNGSDLIEQDDHSIVAAGPCPDKEVYTVTATVSSDSVTALRLEVMTDPSLPLGGPGRQGNGNLHLTELIVSVASSDSATPARELLLVNPRADFNQMPGWTVNDSLDRVAETGWGIYPEVGKTHQAVFDFAEPLSATKPVTLTIQLRQELGRQHLIGRFRLAVRGGRVSPMLEKSTFPAHVLAALAVPADERTEEQRMQLAAFCIQSRIDEQVASLPPVQTVYCGTNKFQASGGHLPSPTPRPVHLLTRGDIRSPGALAHPGAIGCIAELPGDLTISDINDEGQRRAALAHWLTDPRNSLTWRSIANRVWQYHFGRGLVDTPNDFGHMGSAPTHPELLDWLAVQLRENGGSLKSLHRLILTSSVYRQSSKTSAAAARLDAGNRYLSHMTSRRLDGESIRDAILKISGQLDPTIGGPPVKHFVERKVFGLRPEADYEQFNVDDPANNRRSIYRFIFRTMPDPLMNALDCPDGTQLTPSRNESITALQALAMVNDKFIIRQSQHIADRLAAEDDDPKIQVTALYELVMSRPPRADELAAVTQYAEQFGLANACRFVLNTNEFVFVD
jgi:mono/diheme cytochrome c family protein